MKEKTKHLIEYLKWFCKTYSMKEIDLKVLTRHIKYLNEENEKLKR